MNLGVSKPKPYTKERVPNHVSKLSRPKLDFHTHTHSFHTNIHSSLQPKTCIHTCDLLFPFLISSFLFSYSSSSSFLFSSLLSVFALSFSKTKMRYLFWSYPYLILSPFCFTFQGGNFLSFSFKPLVSSTIFFLILF